MATRLYPSYRSIVTTSTDAVLERLILRVAQKDALKTRLGMTDNKPVALFMSTWGRPSLMSTYGEELAREAECLTEDFQLIVSVHPKLRGSRRTQSILRTLEATGVKVILPGVSLQRPARHPGRLPGLFVGPVDSRWSGDEVVRHSAQARSVRDLRTRLWDALERPNREVVTRIRNQFPHIGDVVHLIGTIKSLATVLCVVQSALP